MLSYIRNLTIASLSGCFAQKWMDNDQIENVQKRAIRCIYQEDNVTLSI